MLRPEIEIRSMHSRGPARPGCDKGREHREPSSSAMSWFSGIPRMTQRSFEVFGVKPPLFPKRNRLVQTIILPWKVAPFQGVCRHSFDQTPIQEGGPPVQSWFRICMDMSVDVTGSSRHGLNGPIAEWLIDCVIDWMNAWLNTWLNPRMNELCVLWTTTSCGYVFSEQPLLRDNSALSHVFSEPTLLSANSLS